MTPRMRLIAMLAAGLCSGCANAQPAGPPPTEFATAGRLPDPSPLVDIQQGTGSMLAGLALGQCPALRMVEGDTLLWSTLDHVKAARMLLCRYRGHDDAVPTSATITRPATVESWRR